MSVAPLWLLQHFLAAFVLSVIAFRLATVPRSQPSLACRLRWYAWATSHVLIGLGAFSRLLGLDGPAVLLAYAGMAIYFGIRWRRREDDA